jgi:hypothetical protein
MEYLIEIINSRPLQIRFSLYQPEDSDGPAMVPRVLRPPGYFVTATIRTFAGEVAFKTTEPKVKPKLDPRKDESYLALEPGYSYGAVLDIGEVDVPGGEYVLSIAYDNREYTGSPSRHVGELTYSTELSVLFDD